MFSGYAHRGRDAGCPVGTPLRAGARATVVPFTNDGSFGIGVCLDYGNGLYGLHAHNSELLVSLGDRVTAGQRIALSGNTGYSTGPHCHFQLCVNTQFPVDISYSRDPRDYLISEADMTPEQVNALIEKFVGATFPAYIEAYFSGGFSARNGVASELNPEGKGPVKPWLEDIAARVRTIPGVASDQ